METYTIQDAIKEPNEKIIMRLCGKIVSVYDREEKEGKFGNYFKQAAIIQDETGKIKISFIDYKDMSSSIGKNYIFKSMQGSKGINGVKMSRWNWNGKEMSEVKISGKTALIVEDAQEDNVSLVQDSQISKKIQSTDNHKAKVSHQDVKDGMALVKNRLTQLAGLYDLCWKTVEGLDLLKGEDNFESCSHKDIATTLFIQSCREQLQDRMPVRTTSKFFNDEAIKPVDVKNPDMPLEDSEIPF